MTKHILLCVTGSVASIKLPLLIQHLTHNIQDIEIRVVSTEHAKHFYKQEGRFPFPLTI